MSEIDFSAWEAPPPPEGLADAVVARMAEPEPRPERAPRRRRWAIAASAAAVLAIAGGVWAITRPRGTAAPDHGEVVADKAQHLELGGVSVDLDRGADVRWQRTRTALEIEQRAGAASWRVGKEQHVRIGATVAAIDATGASLRVEVPMNLSDARVIGASAATAAAVAMVTVVVYEGHVKVASSGHTVVVQPGTTYTVPAPAPVVGTATVDARPMLAVFELDGGERFGDMLTGALRERVASLPSVRYVATDKHYADLEILHDCASEAPLCMGAIAKDLGVDSFVYGHITSRRDGYELDIKRFADGRVGAEWYRHIPASEAIPPLADSITATLFDLRPDAPDEAAVQQILAGNADELRACISGGATLRVTINDAGKATAVALDGITAPPCIASIIGPLAFPKSKHGGTFTRTLAPGHCDVDALIEEGNGYLTTRRDPMQALAKYEAAIACKPEERIERLAFMAACNAANVTKAREHWAKLAATSQGQVLQMCVRNGISEETLDGGPAAPAPADGQGRVRIDSVPPAKILLDGKDIGRRTPVVVTAQPGKHKVTLVIGDDRYTWPVTVKAGETQTLSKDLR